MTKDYIYYPYRCCHKFDTLPQVIREEMNQMDSKHHELPHLIRKIIFVIRNDDISTTDLISTVDYFMCTYLFPLEAKNIYWELYVDMIYMLLKEERLLFDVYGINNKPQALLYAKNTDIPDLNQMYNRLTLYGFIAACYKDKPTEIEKCTSDMVFHFEYEVRHIFDFHELEDTDDVLNMKNINLYLMEISNWLSAEANDGNYLKQALLFYERVLSGCYMMRYFVTEELSAQIKDSIVQDYKDVVEDIIRNIEESICEVNDRLKRESEELQKYELYKSAINEKIGSE